MIFCRNVEFLKVGVTKRKKKSARISEAPEQTAKMELCYSLILSQGRNLKRLKILNSASLFAHHGT